MSECTGNNFEFDAVRQPAEDFRHYVARGWITEEQRQFIVRAVELGFTVEVSPQESVIPASQYLKPYFKTDLVIRKSLHNEVIRNKKQK